MSVDKKHSVVIACNISYNSPDAPGAPEVTPDVALHILFPEAISRLRKSTGCRIPEVNLLFLTVFTIICKSRILLSESTFEKLLLSMPITSYDGYVTR